MSKLPGNITWGTSPAQRQLALWGCGGLIAGLIIGIVVTVFGLVVFAPQPQPATPNPASTAGDLSITMDDVYLTQVVNSAVSQASLPISLSNIQVEIQPNNQVKMSGHASTFVPGGSQMVATAQVGAQSGAPTLRILSASVGGLTLPATVTGALELAINAKLAEQTQALLPQGYVITGVSTTEHNLSIAISRQS